MIEFSIDWELIGATLGAISRGEGIIDLPYVQVQLIALGWLLVAAILWSLIYFIFAIPWMFAGLLGLSVIYGGFRILFWVTGVR